MTVLKVYTISGYLQWVGSLIILSVCLYKYSLRPSHIRVLGLYAVLSIVFSLAQEISEMVFSKSGINSIGNGYVLTEALSFSLLFYYAMRNTFFRKGVLTLALLYTILYLITFLFFANHSFSLIRFGRDFLMISYSLTYFYYLIRKLPEENLLGFPMFWINASVLFFFSGTFILSFLIDYIANVLKDNIAGFWAFRNLFRFTFCLVLAYAGWLDWHSIKSKETEAA